MKDIAKSLKKKLCLFCVFPREKKKDLNLPVFISSLTEDVKGEIYSSYSEEGYSETVRVKDFLCSDSQLSVLLHSPVCIALHN